jgi:hypothetical protein
VRDGFMTCASPLSSTASIGQSARNRKTFDSVPLQCTTPVPFQIPLI